MWKLEMSVVKKRNEVSFEAIEMELTCHNIPIKVYSGIAGIVEFSVRLKEQQRRNQNVKSK